MLLSHQAGQAHTGGSRVCVQRGEWLLLCMPGVWMTSVIFMVCLGILVGLCLPRDCLVCLVTYHA